MPCKVCSNPAIFGRVNADVVRKLTLKQLSRKYGLAGRVVLRHIRHLPQLLESEPASSELSIYIGQVTYNFNLVAPASEEVAQGGAGVKDPDLQPDEDEHDHGRGDHLDHADPEEGLGHA